MMTREEFISNRVGAIIANGGVPPTPDQFAADMTATALLSGLDVTHIDPAKELDAIWDQEYSIYLESQNA